MYLCIVFTIHVNVGVCPLDEKLSLIKILKYIFKIRTVDNLEYRSQITKCCHDVQVIFSWFFLYQIDLCYHTLLKEALQAP